MPLSAEATVTSRLHGRMVFVLATPASGAEALLRALDALRQVHVVRVPSHVFAQGLQHVLDHRVIDEERNGLENLAHGDEVLLEARLLGDALFGVPDEAERVVEYSPEHIAIPSAVCELYPDAALIHLVRDGREVAMRLSSGAHGMAPRFAAELWVDEQRAMAALAALPSYWCVRWEDLVTNPDATVATLAARLGLQAGADDLASAAASLPPAFQPRLQGRAAATVELTGADVLARYGYARRSLSGPERMAAWSDVVSTRVVEATRRLTSRGEP